MVNHTKEGADKIENHGIANDKVQSQTSEMLHTWAKLVWLSEVLIWGSWPDMGMKKGTGVAGPRAEGLRD